MKKIIFFLALLPAISYAQPQKSLAGFQDIPWGSSVSEIKKKFPQIKPRDLCQESKKEDRENIKKFFSESDGNCIIWEQENYLIDGVNLLLQFSLNRSNKLKSVNIRKEISISQAPNFEAQCASAFEKIGKLLEVRYGKGFIPQNSNNWFASIGFLNSEVKIWSLAKTQITLTNSWNNKLLDYSLCIMNADYDPIKQSETSKL